MAETEYQDMCRRFSEWARKHNNAGRCNYGRTD